MIGMAIAAFGNDAVKWAPPSSTSPFVKGFASVVLSWVFSPVLSGIAAMVLFFTIRKVVLRSAKPFERAVLIYPLCVMGCVTIITWFMLVKGIKSSKEIKSLDVGAQIGISFGVGAGVAILAIPLYMTCKNRIVTGKMVAAKTALELVDEAQAAGKSLEKVEVEAPTSTTGKIMAAMKASINNDPHESVGRDATTTAVHRNAEKFDKNAEAFFTYLQIFSAIFDSFAHGANDVANAVGPFATIYVVYHSGVVSSKADMGDDAYWILGLGGVGIGVGLLLYGYQILRAIGVKLAVITPSRGFCIEMGSSLVVILGAHLGWPLSTTHCQVGATAGVAMLEGFKGFNKWVLFKTFFGWIFTCFFVGLLAALLFSVGAYSPSAYGSHLAPPACIVNNTAS